MSKQSPAYGKRYRWDRHCGIDRSGVPVEVVAAHIEALVAEGFSHAAIAAVAGAGQATVNNAIARLYPTVYRHVAVKLLSVTAAQIRAQPGRHISRVGTTRRIKALLAIGWRHEDLYARSGICTNLILSRRGDLISSDNHQRIAALYDRLSGTPGPSELGRQRAQLAGYPPPAAWDDDSIDNHDARPTGMGVDNRRTIDLDEVNFLASWGTPWSEVERRIGFPRNSIEIALARAGRTDIGRRVSRNSEGETALTAHRKQWTA